VSGDAKRCFSHASLHEALEHLAIVPAQLYGAPPLDHLREGVRTTFSLGDRTVERPVELQSPILLAGTPNSYTHPDSRLALIHGGGIAKTMVNCGGFGLLPAERKLAGEMGSKTATELNSTRLGSRIDMFTGSDAVVLTLVHGGTGTGDGKAGAVVIPEMLAPELREGLGQTRNHTVLAPPRFLDMDTPRDLNKLVVLLRELTIHEVPVLVKLAPGQVYNDIRVAINAKPDGVILDCCSHSGSSVPDENISETAADAIGLPPIGTLAPMAKAIADGNAEKNDIKIIYAGDMLTGADIFKVMAFGASAVMLSSAPLEAAGIASDIAGSAEKSGFDPAHAGVRIAQFLSDRLTELTALCAWTGHDSIYGISVDNLRAADYNTAAVTGLKLIGYEKILTMWEH